MIQGAIIGAIVGVVVVIVKYFMNKPKKQDNLDDDITIDSKEKDV